MVRVSFSDRLYAIVQSDSCDLGRCFAAGGLKAYFVFACSVDGMLALNFCGSARHYYSGNF